MGMPQARAAALAGIAAASVADTHSSIRAATSRRRWRTCGNCRRRRMDRAIHRHARTWESDAFLASDVAFCGAWTNGSRPAAPELCGRERWRPWRGTRYAFWMREGRCRNLPMKAIPNALAAENELRRSVPPPRHRRKWTSAALDSALEARLRRRLRDHNGEYTSIRRGRAPSPALSMLTRRRFDAINDYSGRHAGTRSSATCGPACVRFPAERRCSYGQLASRIGDPGASRAVGAANGANPFRHCPMPPRHRCGWQADGLCGGLERKKWLLEHERALPPAIVKLAPDNIAVDRETAYFGVDLMLRHLRTGSSGRLERIPPLFAF